MYLIRVKGKNSDAVGEWEVFLSTEEEPVEFETEVEAQKAKRLLLQSPEDMAYDLWELVDYEPRSIISVTVCLVLEVS